MHDNGIKGMSVSFVHTLLAQHASHIPSSSCKKLLRLGEELAVPSRLQTGPYPTSVPLTGVTIVSDAG
jgi:hypothetical protein